MPKTILIVENEKILREVYSKKLSQAGFKTICAGNPQEALFFSRTEKPDIILLDILWQRENGLAILENLRNNAETSKIKVVAFSNFDDMATKKEAKELGAEDYLLKTDFTPNELVEKIKIYLG